ncbi:MAG: cobalamin-binding protein [Pseudomonadota bacterium]|nr:cobalamin-binding protein [Pseudomonadota bacterium]
MLIRGLLLILLSLLAVVGRAEVCVEDDASRSLCLAQPAKRIVALSPGATEILFAAGAGAHMAAAVSFSDYPPAAKKLPRVGTFKRLDLEAILALKPDLVVAWGSGNPAEQVERLVSLGLPVYVSEPRRFEDVASNLERLGRLAGTDAVASGAAKAFRAGVASLQSRYAKASPVTVFYQVWEEPLMTVNNAHLISEAIGVCGGVNVFGDLPALAPRISREAVLEKNPQVIVAGGMGEEDPQWLNPWKRFTSLQAVEKDNLFFIAPSSLQRPTPMMLTGTRTLCRHLESARARH